MKNKKEPSPKPKKPSKKKPLDWAAALTATQSLPNQTQLQSQVTDPDQFSQRPRTPKTRAVPNITTASSNSKIKKTNLKATQDTSLASFGYPLPPGPWLEAFVVQTSFPLQSKSNFRRYHQASKKSGWGELASFEKKLTALFLSQRPLKWELGKDLPLPQRPIVIMAIIARTTYDAANLSKSVLDAAEKVLVVNDASIRFVAQSSIRTKALQSGVIAAALLPPQTPLPEILAASTTLLQTLTSIIDSNSFLKQQKTDSKEDTSLTQPGKKLDQPKPRTKKSKDNPT